MKKIFEGVMRRFLGAGPRPMLHCGATIQAGGRCCKHGIRDGDMCCDGSNCMTNQATPQSHVMEGLSYAWSIWSIHTYMLLVYLRRYSLIISKLLDAEYLKHLYIFHILIR